MLVDECSFDDFESGGIENLFHPEMISQYFSKGVWLESIAEEYVNSLNLEKRSHRSNFKYTMKQILLNALINENEGKITSISLNRNEYKKEYKSGGKKKVGFMSHYHFTYEQIKKAVDWLWENGYIEMKKGSYVKELITTYWLTEKFHRMMTLDKKIIKETLKHREESPYITLTKVVDKKKVPCEFNFTKALTERENLLKNWHELSQASTITYSGGEFINTKLVSRFCRGDESKRLIHGGRFYTIMPYRGISYQQLNTRISNRNPVALRPTLKINGNACVELDFKSMHIAMLLASDGKQVDLNKDFYTIDGWERDFVKLMFLIMINCEDKKEFARHVKKVIEDYDKKVVESEREEYDKYIANYRKLSNDIEAFIKLIPSDLNGHLNEDKGVHLMYQDSQIAELILKHFTDNGILCLPLHDSFIVEAKYENELMEVMLRSYEKVVGFKTKVEKKW